MCALWKFTSDAENFAIAAISKGEHLQQIPRLGKYRSLLIELLLYGGFV
jgi:hypothetical protein